MSTVTLLSFNDLMKQHGDIGKNVRFVDDPVKNDAASDTTTVAEEDLSFVTGGSDITLQDEQPEQLEKVQVIDSVVKVQSLKSRFKQALRLSSQSRRRRYVQPVEEDFEPPTVHMEQYHPAAAVPTLSYSVCGPGSKQQPIHPLSPPAVAAPKIKGILKKPPPPSYELEEEPSAIAENVQAFEKKPSVRRRVTWMNKIKSTMSSQQPASKCQQPPAVVERKRTIRYNKMVIVHETYTRHEYNREPDPYASCAYLTAEEAQEIKNELNMFKFNEMKVHPTSRIYTHFFI